MRQVMVIDDVTDIDIAATRGTRTSRDASWATTAVRCRSTPATSASRWNTARWARRAGRAVWARAAAASAPTGRSGSTRRAGHRSVRVSSLPPRWIVKSATLDGADITDQLFELNEARRRLDVVLTNRGGDVIGTVTDRANRPIATATVVVFPEDQSRWTSAQAIRATGSGAEGRYAIADLPPADYRAVAVESLPEKAWRDPGVLDRLSAFATPFRLQEGEQRSLTLKLSPMPAGLIQP